MKTITKSSAKTNKSTKNQIVEIAKEETKNVISSTLQLKKFIGLDYQNLSSKEQKRFRSQIRRKLFNIINAYSILKLQKQLTKENAKENFELFKAFVKENYSIPFSEVENVFKGQSNKSEDFKLYVSDFKAYLALDTKK